MDMKPNIVLVGAGRRYSFVERLLATGFKVCAVELDKQAPISEICEVIPAYGNWNKDRTLIGNLATNNDGFILPLNDQATFELASCERVIGHSKTTAEICYNKSKFQEFMLLHFDMYYPKADIEDDIIIKPIYGASSKGIRFDRWKYESWCDYDCSNEVMQRKIEGIEYSVDAYFSKRGECIGCVPRTRERVAGGEVVDSRTVNHEMLSDVTRIIGRRLAMTGPACFQYMVEKGTNHPYLFEINARFGGGSILSLEAGFDMIDMIRQEYWLEKHPYHSPIAWGLYMRRVNREVFF